jgi:4'-phosphopantetheinyl transferase
VLFEESKEIKWQKGTPESISKSAFADVWRIPLTSYIKHIPELYHTLQSDEKARSASFLKEKDRNRFIVGRAMLRILLGEYLHIEADMLRFDFDKNNKPILKHDGKSVINFNLSHSGEYVLIAISDKFIGIDIERYEYDSGLKQIMELIFSDSEISFINKQDSPLRIFYKLWTRKEALLKANSSGLSNMIKYIPCLNGNYPGNYSSIISFDNWKVNSFYIDEEHPASVAYTGDQTKLFFRQYNGLNRLIINKTQKLSLSVNNCNNLY